MVDELIETFPGLARGGYRITSSRTRKYNCIAWAAGDTDQWWWPIPEVKEAYWPAGVDREETLSAFREAFASLGYVECRDAGREADVEKVALFANDTGVPSHASRQTGNGMWTSKLGEMEDIEHALHDLEGAVYGAVAAIMKRPYP